MKQMTLADGRRLHYVEIGQGPVLVLLHGWGMSCGIFAGLLPELGSAFRLLIPDLRGHGQSDPGPGYRLADFAGDLLEWLTRLDINQCHLLGWSFGGQIALQLAADRSLGLAKLILVAATPRFCQGEGWSLGLPEGQVRAMQRQLRRDPAATLSAFVNLMYAGEDHATRLSASTLRQLHGPEGTAGAQSLVTLRESDLRDALADIDCPTLIEHGRADQVVPVAAGEFLARRLPQAECTVWAGVGHAPFVSSPQRSLALWKEFLL